MCCQTNIVQSGPSPAVPVNRPKGKHPLYGSLTAIELPNPREESRMINLAGGTSVTRHFQDFQSLALVTTKSSKTRPDDPSRSRAAHAPRQNVIAYQGSTRSPRTSELIIPYGTFEGSFHEIAPAKTKKVAFEEDKRSMSSWSTIISGDSKA